MKTAIGTILEKDGPYGMAVSYTVIGYTESDKYLLVGRNGMASSLSDLSGFRVVSKATNVDVLRLRDHYQHVFRGVYGKLKPFSDPLAVLRDQELS